MKSDSRPALTFNENTVTLTGNGDTVVRVDACGFEFLRGGVSPARVEFLFSNQPVDIVDFSVESSVSPGCVEFRLVRGSMTLRILHGAFAECGYFAAVEVTGADPASVGLSRNPQEMGLSERRVGNAGGGMALFFLGDPGVTLSYDGLRDRSREKYHSQGFLLQGPSQRLNMAAAFSQQLLDLSFDGHLMVCEIYRWKDVWARDLATGLLAGALASGRGAMARRSLDYDLARYGANDPVGLKNQDDTSKGGTIDGVAWTLHSLWQAYLHDGDKEKLAEGFRIMEPWVRQWSKREVGGLVADLTENFDHIYHLLAPDGVRTLGGNALFALMLRNASRIAGALGLSDESAGYEALHARSAGAIDHHFWNEELGGYVNLIWCGDQDLRTNQVYHSLLVLADAIPADRARRVLETLRLKNHTPWGSLTMMPPLTHVEPDNDQNATIWPWWNLWEAQARYDHGDAGTAYRLLDLAARTIETPEHPGFMKEIISPEGHSIGGRAFVTGAGNLLDTLVRGLLGCSRLSPGHLRVMPQLPADWDHCNATIPTAGGCVDITWRNGRLMVDVRDPHIVSVEAPAEAVVLGAAHEKPTAAESSLRPVFVPAAPIPPPRALRAQIFAEPGFPSTSFDALQGPTIPLSGLARLVEDTECGALVIPGSALPLRLPDGTLVPDLLSRFLDRGGALVFFGASASPRSEAAGKGSMAEACGLIDWYDWLPTGETLPLRHWEMALSDFDRNAPDEAGADPARDWMRAGGDGRKWMPFTPLEPAEYLSPTGNWIWYRTTFTLPREFKGRPLFIELGPVEDYEFLFVNGTFAGDFRTQRHTREHTLDSARLEMWDLSRNVPRVHRIDPGSEAYEGLVFGGENQLYLQVYRTYGAVGFASTEIASIRVETGRFAWQATDPDRPGLAFPKPWRKGVAYWGGEKYFNSWETRLGASALAVAGDGVAFASSGPLAGLGEWEGPVNEVFTDFAVFQPWRFEPLALTRTHRGILHPQVPEQYPCLARLVNERTGGEIVLIGESLAHRPEAGKLLLAAGVRH